MHTLAATYTVAAVPSPRRDCALLACGSHHRERITAPPLLPSSRPPVAASPSRCRDTSSPPALPTAATSRCRPLPPYRRRAYFGAACASRRRAYFGAACPSLRRDAPSSPPLPAAATLRRRLPVQPPRLRVAACTPRSRDFASPPARPRRRDLLSPPAHPAAATYRRRLHVPPPRLRVAACTPHPRDLKPPPARPAAATSSRASASRRRDLLVAPCASHRRDFASSPPPAAAPAISAATTAPPAARISAAATTPSSPALPAAAPPCPRLPTPPPADFATAAATSTAAAATLAADRSAVNWHSFVGSIRRILQDAFVGPYCVLDVLLRRPHALQPTAPIHPGEPPPPSIPPSPPPPEPTLVIAATPELQEAADATFLHDRREYLIRKAEHEVAVHHHDFAIAERATRLALLDEYNTAMADYLPKSIAWATADNRACTILLGALPDALMRRFQAREMRASLIWAELQAMFERRDISSVGVLFQEYFSITIATCDGAVDYVGRMQEVADRLAARQAALPEPLQIHRLLYNLTPDYESRLHAFTEANSMAGLNDVVQWIIDTEVKLRTPIVNLTTPQSSSSTSLNTTQPRNQGGRNGGGGGRGGGGSGGGGRGGGGGGRGGRGGGGGSATPGGPAWAGGTCP
ncbi:unnamed protein product [Closterium sp. Naga37s-1]|nr:unnamed protein product [Closterium sp. Naga37s-1]